MLEKTERELQESIKELNCLYSVSSLAQQVDLSREQLFHAILDAVVLAYQSPEMTCARIIFDGQVYLAREFQETPLRHAAPLLDGQAVGTLEVFRREAGQPLGTKPFLVEEQALLDAVARIISKSLTARREQAARQASEAHARRREREFRTLAENSPDIIVRFDKALRHLYVNPIVHKFTGLPPEAFIGRTVAETGMPEDLVALWEPTLRRAIETGGEQRMEFHFPSPAGDRFLESRLIPEPGSSGPAQSVLVITRDLSERKEAEDQLAVLGSALEKKNAELEQANRWLAASNEELRQFTAVVSHDLKSPLRAVHSLSCCIEEEVGKYLSDDGRQRMELLRERVLRMDNLIEALLNYSRAGAIRELDEVDTADLVAELIKSLDIPGGFTVSWEPALPRFRTDRLHLRQVFANLIGNAVEHHDRPTGHVWVSAREFGDYYEFSVADDGPGIPASHHERVFEMFQRLNPAGNGTGMGLAVVRKVIESVGGRIHIQSDEGEGTTFRFTWPKAIKESHAPAQ